MIRPRALVGLALLFVASPAFAQWSSDPAVNLAVAAAAGDQVQTKVAPTADGGAWISWFDAIANGFDVRVQKLDAGGNAMLAAGGVLVADRSFTSTQDYGLAADGAGNAVLAFRDTRFTGVQITAALIAPNGASLWGPTGVQLTSTTSFVASPRVTATSDGGTVVAWTQDSDARLQKLDGFGVPIWGTDVVLIPTVGSYSPADLHGAGTAAIVSFVHQSGGFGSPRLLLAQKFDAAGVPVWGATPVSVFDGGSLQFGGFPEFVPDGSGGAVFAWYDVAAPALQSSVQRILANGAEAFAHNGVVVSTDATRIRVGPDVSFDPTTQETFVVWKEQNAAQSSAGVYAQKLDAAGGRQWTSTGVPIVALGSNDITLVRCHASGGGAFAFWGSAPAFGQNRLYGARVSALGGIDIPVFDVASVPSGKSRLAIGESTSGFAILAWGDERTDSGDIYAQNVNADGSLGSGGSAVAGLEALPTALALGAAHPNPTRGPVGVSWAVPSGASARLVVHDVQGRLVRTLLEGAEGRLGRAEWDGRDAGGAPVAAGVYFLVLEGGDEARSARVTVVR